jgi:chromosome segregation ATPase
MLVSISKAAEMVGVTRATLYRHIDKKGISVQKDEDNNPKIDISELMRVYGDKVTPLEQLNTREEGRDRQDNTTGEQAGLLDTQTELEVLKERLRNAAQERGRTDEERKRERDQLTEQIEMLTKRLEASEEQQKRLTLLLTDQREEKEGRGGEQEKKIQALEVTIEELKKQNRRILFEVQKKNRGFFGRLFGSNLKTAKA